jgi:hypothetical protein
MDGDCDADGDDMTWGAEAFAKVESAIARGCVL